MSPQRSIIFAGLLALIGFLFSAVSTSANIPGGGTGTGPNVTVTDNGNGTVTMANGVLSTNSDELILRGLAEVVAQ